MSAGVHRSVLSEADELDARELVEDVDRRHLISCNRTSDGRISTVCRINNKVDRGCLVTCDVFVSSSSIQLRRKR